MMATDDEIQLAVDRRQREKTRRLHDYRLERFLLDGFSVDEAVRLERAGADYHLADRLYAASCPADVALKILL